MVIDCDSCIARPRACGDCVVTHLLSVTTARGRPLHRSGNRGVIALDDEEVVAVATLTAAGLLPPLRLVPPEPGSRSVGARLRVVQDMPSSVAG